MGGIAALAPVAIRQDAARAFKEYFGYFGTFSVESERGAVIHHVTGGWFPNLEGSDQVRFFQFEDERLILNADTAWGKVRIVWAHAVSINPAREDRFSDLA